MPALTARGLVLPPVLAGVDLDVADGELVVLTGDTGAGTSTLLRVLAGRQPVPQGTVDGEAVLLEEPPGSEWADGDVAGQVADPGLLVELGMRSPPERELWMLSGGERQRVRLARALAAPPSAVLLLDEPLGQLDVAGVRAVLARLAGRTAVVVAKADPRAAAVAGRVLTLEGGQLRLA